MDSPLCSVQTPLRRGKDFRRTAILQNARAENSMNISTLEQSLINDEQERAAKRSFVETQRRLSHVPSATGSPHSEQSFRFSGEKEMQEHFQICAKLHAENKINVKNAWQLHIIDLIRLMSKKTGLNALQMASTSLDIGAKVYGIRVDDLHSDSLKLANLLGRVHREPADKDEEQGNAEEASTTSKKNKRIRRTGNKPTLVKDVKSLFCKPQKLESVTFATRVNSENTSVENLFTNTLPLDPCGCKFNILNSDQRWCEGEDVISKKTEGAIKLGPDFFAKVNPICVAFKDFQLNKWDPELEEKQLILNDTENQTEMFSVIARDEDGIPIADLDGSIHNPFDELACEADNVSEPEEMKGAEAFAQLKNDLPPIVLMKPEEIPYQQSEYTYNSLISTYTGELVEKMWAGPSHWKLMCLKRNKPIFTGISNKPPKNKPKTTKKTKEENQKIDIINMSNKYLNGPEKRLSKTKKKTTIVDFERVSIPPVAFAELEFLRLLKSKELNLKNQKLDSFFITQNNYVTQGSDVNFNSQPCVQNECFPEIEDIQNDGDADGLVPDYSDAENEMQQEEMEICAMAAAPQGKFSGENLVEAPEYVPTNYLTYSHHAKKMDMKKLKKTIWDVLLLSGGTSQGDAQRVSTTMAELNKLLPPLLPANMSKELSKPLVLAALLHLCNEKILKLESISPTDFHIFSV